MNIRNYRETDNLGWTRCRVLSFLDSAYFDNVLREKEHYQNPAIELVAEVDGKIVGLIDIEYEINKKTVCYKTDELGGVLWHLAVLPEYRNQGIATKLFNEAVVLLRDKNITIIQAWTRDDKWVNEWYKNRGFSLKESYLHVYAQDDECDIISDSKINKVIIYNCFSHYDGKNKDEIRKKFKRVHDCNLYEFHLTSNL